MTITVTLAGDGWCSFQSTGTCLFFYHSLSQSLEAIHFPSNGCPKCKQYFGYEARKCFILFQLVARTLQKDPLRIKNETCSEKCADIFMLVIVCYVSQDTKLDNEMHK